MFWVVTNIISVLLALFTNVKMKKTNFKLQENVKVLFK